MQITPAYEIGKCSVCKKKTEIRILVLDKKVANICKECVAEIGNMTSEDFVKKYGKTPKKKRQKSKPKGRAVARGR